MRSGFVSIVGRPNVGKSTLLNSIVNAKLAITSNVPGTTRNTIEGIYNEPDVQIIFIDTPGIHKPQNKLGKILNRESYTALRDIDAILFLVDATEHYGAGDEFILRSLKGTNVPVILVINKIDKITDEEIVVKINEYKDLYPFSDIVPVSALKDDNIAELIRVVKNYLTDDIRYYNENQVTNLSPKFMISELVREKVLRLTSNEVPHSVTCLTTHYEIKKDIVEVYVDIIVDRDSLKKIIIGKGGAMLKEIGTQARADIETMFDKKVYLELYCKTVPKWRDREALLKDLGFSKDNE
ncbi:MAG TPA: GTPase Era [Firmicutes bacterium]|nr:GTPase Era [Bacillota bacterium]